MFDKDRFIEDCISAVPDGREALRELVLRAVADSRGVMAALGEPGHAGLTPLFRSSELTILNLVWAPWMSLMPHNHEMFSVVGTYAGREDNIFWWRTPKSIEAASARSLGPGEVATLGEDAIHSVLNPLARMTCAIHVYGGDFFAPTRPRSAWDHETLSEEPWDMDKVKAVFHDAEARCAAALAGGAAMPA